MRYRIPISEKPWLRRPQLLLFRLLGGTMTILIIMSEEAYARFCVLRANVAELRGNKPTTYNDVVNNAIDNYYKLIQARRAGKEILIEDPTGKEERIRVIV